MMLRVFAGFAAFLATLVAVQASQAQEFKLPSLLPFRKSTSEVKPFRLTDGPAPRPGMFDSKPLSNLFGSGSSRKSNRWEEFNQGTKDFFARTGENLSKFATETGQKLKKLESPGWQFGPSGHRWNDNPDVEALHRDLGNAGLLAPPQPQPRTARQFESNPPRHRF
jgi:hypothetical protein